jgi:cytidylate kinase
MGKQIKIAIDGPAASGKSTSARLVAQKLGYLYIDTGAMYRAFTLAIIQKKIDMANKYSIIELAKKIDINLVPTENGTRTFLDGNDVTEDIRLPLVNKRISVISSYSEIRDVMVEKQRELANEGGVVMDGRDIGTTVLPNAEVKIYLDASLDERANRRYKELKEKGVSINFEEVKSEILHRDKIDSSRQVSPLKPADDAYIIDTSNLKIYDQVRQILEKVNEVIQD